MDSCWIVNMSLTSFPSIDTSKVTNMYSCWFNCGSLTSFPAINTGSVVDGGMDFTWYFCVRIETFGGVSDCSKSDSTTWQYCDALTPIPCGW